MWWTLKENYNAWDNYASIGVAVSLGILTYKMGLLVKHEILSKHNS